MSSRVLVPVVLLLALSGCTQEPVVPMPLPTNTSPSASPSAPDPNTAEGKLAAFDATNTETIHAADGHPEGRAFIDGLVVAGFDKGAMQLTPDKTAIGLAADSVQFSVRVGDECLVGQFGNVGYHSVILPAVDSGGCLIGTTRPINW